MQCQCLNSANYVDAIIFFAILPLPPIGFSVISCGISIFLGIFNLELFKIKPSKGITKSKDIAASYIKKI